MPFARYFCIFINVGLGEGAPAIGVPFFWPSAAMPNTVIDSWSSMVFLKFNGAKFSATDYPVLAKVFPSLVLPEARGDFIRIWDDGRGADGGRELWHCCKVSDEAAFCLIQRPYISKTLLTRRISPRGSP